VRCSDCNHKIPAHCIRVERLGKSCGDIAKHATSIVIHHTRIVKTENQRKHINNSHSLAKLWLENRAQMTLKDLIIAEKNQCSLVASAQISVQLLLLIVSNRAWKLSSDQL